MHAEAAPQPGKRMILDPPATMSSTALHMTSTALLQRAGGGWVWCRRPGEVLDAVEVRVLDGRDARVGADPHGQVEDELRVHEDVLPFVVHGDLVWFILSTSASSTLLSASACTQLP